MSRARALSRLAPLLACLGCCAIWQAGGALMLRHQRLADRAAMRCAQCRRSSATRSRCSIFWLSLRRMAIGFALALCSRFRSG